MDQAVGLVWEASAEVVRPPHAQECLARHPGLACPGWPHWPVADEEPT